MKPTKNLAKLFPILFVLFCLFTCPGASEPETNERITKVLAKELLRQHVFNINTPLISRVKPAPEPVLAYLKDIDKRDNYSAYLPSSEDIELIKSYIQKLPGLHKKVLQERLIGIYFINNLFGSGFTDYMLNEKNEIYTIIVLNPLILSNDISEWLTDRELTCFINNNPEITIEINCGKEYKGLLFVLLHEATHVVDYIMNWTPYFDDEIRIAKGLQRHDTDFVKNVWKDLFDPVEVYDYPFRKEVTFYGFDDGPKINITDALTIYKELLKTPFVSIYSSQNWLEDFADFISFYQLTEVLNQPYTITYFKNGKLIYTYAPMKSPVLTDRFSAIKGIYRYGN